MSWTASTYSNGQEMVRIFFAIKVRTLMQLNWKNIPILFLHDVRISFNDRKASVNLYGAYYEAPVSLA